MLIVEQMCSSKKVACLDWRQSFESHRISLVHLGGKLLQYVAADWSV
jgi:hypothetical protein